MSGEVVEVVKVSCQGAIKVFSVNFLIKPNHHILPLAGDSLRQTNRYSRKSQRRKRTGTGNLLLVLVLIDGS